MRSLRSPRLQAGEVHWTLWGWYDPGEPCSMGFYTFHEAVDAMVARSKNPAEALVGPLVEWRGSMLVDQSTVSEALSEQASVDLSSPDLVEKVVKSVMAQAVAELDDKCDHVELEERVGEEATEEMRAILEDCATTVLLGYARDAVREWADKHILTHRPRVCSGDVVLPARYTRGAWRSPEAKGEAEATVDWSGGAWKATVGGVTVEAGSFLDAIEAAEKMMGAK